MRLLKARSEKTETPPCRQYRAEKLGEASVAHDVRILDVRDHEWPFIADATVKVDDMKSICRPRQTTSDKRGDVLSSKRPNLDSLMPRRTLDEIVVVERDEQSSRATRQGKQLAR